MDQNINEQFTQSARQFADTVGQINRLALDSLQKTLGQQMEAITERATANFAFLGEAVEVRDAAALKALLPKAAQVARENIERAVSTGQEVLGGTIRTGEAIASIAKAQAKSAAAGSEAGTSPNL